MNDDVRRFIYGTLVGFGLLMAAWFGLIYVSSCGFSLNCYQALPLVIRTPIPTLIPAAHEAAESPVSEEMPEFSGCLVSAQDLIAAWVAAGSPESEPFPFNDANGHPCEGTFAEDVQRLFVDSNVWYEGQLGCTSCHNANLTERSAGLDLSSHEGILAGAQNKDILGGGDWESSILHDVLLVRGFGPEGHSPDTEPLGPVFLYTGQQLEEAALTPTATP